MCTDNFCETHIGLFDFNSIYDKHYISRYAINPEHKNDTKWY